MPELSLVLWVNTYGGRRRLRQMLPRSRTDSGTKKHLVVPVHTHAFFIAVHQYVILGHTFLILKEILVVILAQNIVLLYEVVIFILHCSMTRPLTLTQPSSSELSHCQ